MVISSVSGVMLGMSALWIPGGRTSVAESLGLRPTSGSFGIPGGRTPVSSLGVWGGWGVAASGFRTLLASLLFRLSGKAVLGSERGKGLSWLG